MNVFDDDLVLMIKKHEGFKNKPYLDTVGKLTIGYGRNLDDNGISRGEADFMILNDINRAIKELENYSWYLVAPLKVKQALIDMNFNLGLSRFLSFRKMIRALIYKDYKEAAREALNSKWASQVGDRAKTIAVMMSEQ